jgi:rod shape-determining protein MreC
MSPRLKDLKKAQLSMSQEISVISAMIVAKVRAVLFLLMVFCLVLLLNSKNQHITSIRSKAVDSMATLYQTLNVPINWLDDSVKKIHHSFKAAKVMPELIIENNNLKQRVSDLEDMLVELDRLRALMTVVDNQLFSPITAKVVSENFRNTDSKFLINAGSKDGIAEGMAVINQTGFIGMVVEVYGRSARVMTIRDEQSSIPAIARPSNIRLILRGESSLVGDNLNIYHADGGFIPPGEKVQTSNDGDLIPSGIEVGIISEDGKSLIPNFKANDLDYVLILRINKS